MSLIQDKNKIRPVSKSYGIGQTLFRDYYVPDIFQIIREMVDDVARRLRLSKKLAKTIHFGIGYSKEFGGGFARQVTLSQPTSSETTIFKACLDLFDFYYEGNPIRRIHVSASGLVANDSYQFSLFEDAFEVIKEQDLFQAMDEIKFRFGKNSVNRASTELPESTIKARNGMIGGHHA